MKGMTHVHSSARYQLIHLSESFEKTEFFTDEIYLLFSPKAKGD